MALSDFGKMRERGGGIVEEAQCDPAGGELMLGAVVVFAGNRGLTRDPVGSFGVADVEQLAGDEPALDPPLVGIDRLSVLGGQRQNPFGGLTCLVSAAEKLGAAEDVASIAVRFGRHRVEQRLGVRCLADY